MRLGYGIDSVAVREGKIFGWGWYLSDDGPAITITLRIVAADGVGQRIACTAGGLREDLAQAFPQLSYAAGGGFQIMGRYQGVVASDRVFLDLEFGNASVEQVELHGFARDYLCVHRGSWQPDRIASWGLLLRRRSARELLGRIYRGIRRRWQRSAAAVRSGDGSTVIVFDHDMGGGATRFREELIDAMVAKGDYVYLVSPHLPSLGFQLLVRSGQSCASVMHSDIDTCLASLPSAREIVLNDLVSFDDPARLLHWVLQRHRAQGVALRVYAHDYFAVCPVWTLIDDSENYCGVPDIERCRTCLARNRAPFLAYLPERDIESWRMLWGEVLQAANQLIVFSQSTATILRRAFPELDQREIDLQPHRVDYLPARRFRPRFDDGLVIGIVGHINRFKGAGIVHRMCELITERHLRVRVIVFGSIEGEAHASSVLEVTGPYNAHELPDLLESRGVGVCFLPSICPETFSYVTAELMHFEVPLAVFDLGAPAERVREYDKGCIVSGITAEAALDALLAFAARVGATTEQEEHQARLHAQR